MSENRGSSDWSLLSSVHRSISSGDAHVWSNKSSDDSVSNLRCARPVPSSINPICTREAAVRFAICVAITPQAEINSVADAMDSKYSGALEARSWCDTASTGAELPFAKAAVTQE